ncbi:MAG: leucine-rich repeat protein, partial [Bacillota bacterium]
VTQIGGYAFVDSTQLTGVSIPDSVESIGTYAFFNCNHPSLTQIVLPESVENIGSFAFGGCASLTNIVIPEGITRVEEYTFSGCSDLTDAAIPESVLNIGAYAFFGCESIERITIPKYVENIGDYAFGFCMNLKKILVPGNTTFGSNVFLFSAIKSGGANGIYGYDGSTAQTYAQANGIAFHPLYTVSFSADEGTPVPDIAAAAGDRITKPDNPTHPTQYFAGWYQDAACTDDWDFDSDTVSGDTVLYAKWSSEPVYTVPEITTTSLPDGRMGAPYSQALAANYGAPITWSITSGCL